MSDTTTRATRAPGTKRQKTTAAKQGAATGQSAKPDTSPTRPKRPKYAQIAEDLRAQITAGQFPPASLLPSESKLIERYGVSKITARAAIAALRSQGLVTVVNGVGAVVRRAGERPSHTHTRAITRSSGPDDDRGYSDADTDDDGWWPAEEPTTYRVNATPALALAAGVAEHTPLFGVDRLLENAAGRRLLHRLYVPFSIVADVPALESDPFVPAGRLYTLLTEAGHALAWTEYVTARNPNPDDAATLRVPDGTPIITTRRITHQADDASAQPLAMEETHRSAEDTQLAFHITPSETSANNG